MFLNRDLWKKAINESYKNERSVVFCTQKNETEFMTIG